jgi:hypothetical protein
MDKPIYNLEPETGCWFGELKHHRVLQNLQEARLNNEGKKWAAQRIHLGLDH